MNRLTHFQSNCFI